MPVLLRPSAESRPDGLKLPPKSVLKAPTLSPASSPITEAPNPTESSLLVMIESIIQNLSGHDRASKLETYTTLSNLFRAFDNMPDRAQLLPRIAEIFRLIMADVLRMTEENPELPDVPLNTKALKVAGFMLFDTQIAAALPAKLARSLVEYSLVRMEAEHVSKSTSTQILWLWQTQHLPRTVLGPELAERMLLAAMKVDFPSIIINQERMSVLLRLLEQSKDKMIKHAEVWLPCVISCMLDENKQIRTAALRTALAAGKQLCRVPSVGRCVQNHLRSEVAGVPFIEVTSERFQSMMQEPEGGIYVAHAWGSICTLSSSQNPEKSKTLMAWMHVLQIVFNSSTTENKIMAQSVWVRMIHYFTNNGDVVYREKNLSYLMKPMSRMLSKDLKVYDTVRMAAVNSVCSLLYALMKPSLTHSQANLVWTEVVEPIISVMLEDFQKEAIQYRAIHILISLLEHNSLEPWTLERLLDGKVGSETEIMHFDPRWVRNNASRVTRIITIALQSGVAEDLKLRLWACLQNGLRTASAKEIQISAETMEATAALCNVFRTLWTAQLPAPEDAPRGERQGASERTAFVTNLILCSFEQFGPSYFTEKTLSFPDGLTITPAQTPSKEHPDTPLVGPGVKFLFNLFQNPVSAAVVGDEYINSLEKIMLAATAMQKSLRKCLALLLQCLSCISAEKSKVSVQSWKVLAEIAQKRINDDIAKVNKPHHDTPPVHVESDENWHITKELLIFGARIQHGGAYEEWCSLAGTLQIAGDMKLGSAETFRDLPEELSAILLESDCLRHEYVQQIMKMAKYPESDPTWLFRNVFCLISRTLVKIESTWKKYKLSEEILTYIADIADFLDQPPGKVGIEIMSDLCAAVSGFVVRSQEGTIVLVSSVLRLMQRSSATDSLSLGIFASFIEACLESSDEAVLNHAVSFWNVTFGRQPIIEYPTSLVNIIQNRNLLIDQLSLPSWPVPDLTTVKIQSDGIATTAADQPPPRMMKLTRSTEKESISTRRHSRLSAASQASETSFNLDMTRKSEPAAPSTKEGSRKRKRSTRKSTDSSKQESPISVSAVSGPPKKSVSSITPSPAKRKRQKRSRTSEHGSPAELPIDTDHFVNDDVFGVVKQEVFTLKKRELRAMSPLIHSDPISESSPSIYSRIRQVPSSQERTTMEELRHSVRSLSPSEAAGIIVLEDDPELSGLVQLMGEDEITSPLRPKKIAMNSDDIMQLQVQENLGEEVQNDEETTDEDLFILQLQQYRASLKQGEAITPRRRQKLGTLMKEITKLNGIVTEAYLDSAG